MKKTILLALTVLVGVSAFAISPKVSDSKSIDFRRIQTTNVKHYPAGSTQNCAWFVEAVQ